MVLVNVNFYVIFVHHNIIIFGQSNKGFLEFMSVLTQNNIHKFLNLYITLKMIPIMFSGYYFIIKKENNGIILTLYFNKNFNKIKLRCCYRVREVPL